MKQLTPRQQEVFDFIKYFIDKKRWPPSYQEIADHFRFTLVGALGHLRALKKKGVVTFRPGIPRSIRILKDPRIPPDPPPIPQKHIETLEDAKAWLGEDHYLFLAHEAGHLLNTELIRLTRKIQKIHSDMSRKICAVRGAKPRYFPDR